VTRRSSARVAALSAVVVVLAGCGNDGLPDPVTEQGSDTERLWSIFLAIALVIGLIVYALVGIVLVKHLRNRRRSDLPSQRQTVLIAEVVYTLVPLGIVAVLLTLSQIVQSDASELSDDPDLTVEVIGFQWQWQFRYPDEGIVVTGTPGEGPPVLVLPTDRTIQFALISNDVVHSFWVPRFVTKRDLTPGITTRLEVTVDEPGEWSGVCSEFCGLDHWKMDFAVRAVPPDEFDAWVAATAEARP
jgi:cytochrome c oxidase subunit II